VGNPIKHMPRKRDFPADLQKGGRGGGEKWTSRNKNQKPYPGAVYLFGGKKKSRVDQKNRREEGEKRRERKNSPGGGGAVYQGN